MLDFTPLRTREKTIGQLTAVLTLDDLRHLTDEIIDRMLALIVDCNDTDEESAFLAAEMARGVRV